jgi:hypothetical protein
VRWVEPEQHILHGARDFRWCRQSDALREFAPGTPGWEIPASAGTVISGYASETSVAPGQSFHLHVAAPPGSRYRVLVYRLGWYQGSGAPNHVRARLPL